MENANKDPFKNMELFLLPALVAGASYVLRVFGDLFCYDASTPHFDFEYADVCHRWSDLLTHVYMAILFVVVFVVGSTNVEMFQKVKVMLGMFGKAKMD